MYKNRLSQGFAASVALIFVMATGQAAACGESLFHVGKGVIVREYTAPLPGKILMVARTEGELMMAERLAAAGHDIHVVADPQQVGNELGTGGFDIVMSLYSQHEVVEPQTLASAVSYLPVAQEGTAEVDDARTVTPNALSTDDSVKRFLRAIHRTLKQSRRA